MAYDKLGRMVQRNEPDLVSTWTYDTCAKGIGKLCQAAADNGYVRTHSYDALGRASAATSTIDAAYTTAARYDAHGRIATQTYPTGFAVRHVYTALGYLAEVRNNATGALFWKADRVDASGHLTQQTYGNGITTNKIYQATTGRLTEILAGAGNAVQNLGYQYDSIGNLTKREDHALGTATAGPTPAATSLSENFAYDRLNRWSTTKPRARAARRWRPPPTSALMPLATSATNPMSALISTAAATTPPPAPAPPSARLAPTLSLPSSG